LKRYYLTKDKLQLLNAGKYSTGIVVSGISAFMAQRPDIAELVLPVWIICSLISTCYTFSWDIIMDWGLGNRYSKNKFLRDRLLYPSKKFYYCIMGGNFLLRLMWTLSLSNGVVLLFDNPLFLSTFVAIIEVFRRGMWNLLRMENEQVANVGKYKTIHEIPQLISNGVGQDFTDQLFTHAKIKKSESTPSDEYAEDSDWEYVSIEEADHDKPLEDYNDDALSDTSSKNLNNGSEDHKKLILNESPSEAKKKRNWLPSLLNLKFLSYDKLM